MLHIYNNKCGVSVRALSIIYYTDNTMWSPRLQESRTMIFDGDFIVVVFALRERQDGELNS